MAISSLFAGFNTAVRAMQSAQFALTVHSSNIAHANDKTYTRRDVLTPSQQVLNGPGVARLRDGFVDDQYRYANGSAGQAKVMSNVLGKVEDIFGDPVDGGLRKSIDQFFDSWQGLAESPSDGVARLQVLSAGRTFVQQIKDVHGRLQSVEDTVNEELTTRVNEVNTGLHKVYDLNIRISELHRSNMNDADLRDQRDEVLDNLAKLTGATAIEQNDGTVRVIVGSTPVVDGPTVLKLQLVANPPAGPLPTWNASYAPAFGGAGTVSGLVSVRDNELQQLKKDIDSLAKTIANAINTQHKQGTGIGGVTNKDFFLVGNGPVDVVVDPSLQPSQIAAGASSGLPSDGDNARKLAQLGQDPLMSSIIIPGQFQAPRTYYRNLVGWIGSKAQETQQLQDVAETHIRIGEQQRQSIWGVSMDEEVANLSMQQKAFAAAARVINVMDEMLNSLINRM